MYLSLLFSNALEDDLFVPVDLNKIQQNIKSNKTNPLEAGLSWITALDKKEFIGIYVFGCACFWCCFVSS